MNKYVLELVLYTGSDEYWGALENQSDADRNTELMADLVDMFSIYGFDINLEGPNDTLTLKSVEPVNKKIPMTKMINRNQTDRQIFEWLLAGKTLVSDEIHNGVATEIAMVDDYVMLVKSADPIRKDSLMLMPDLNPYQWRVKGEPISMTLQEIEDLLGYPVKIV